MTPFSVSQSRHSITHSGSEYTPVYSGDKQPETGTLSEPARYQKHPSVEVKLTLKWHLCMKEEMLSLGWRPINSEEVAEISGTNFRQGFFISQEAGR